MEPTQQPDPVKSRFLILSDTHAKEFESEEIPCQHADVAIHCGDLTEESKLEEFESSLRLLKSINAPIKLVIAGNHDFTLDTPTFRQHVADPGIDDLDLISKVYGEYGKAREIFEDAKAEGIILLDEGNHEFFLKNGALLTVYASPWTPSASGWGFQYDPKEGHDFEIAEGVDVVVTHGPPKGIMDYTDSRTRAGCSDLFGAVARARPRLHCFGHIHLGWGGKLVTWRDQISDTLSHFTDIDNDKSVIVEKLSSFRQSKFDSPKSKEEKLKKREHYQQERCYTTSHYARDAHPLEYGAQTLFINAAINGNEEYPLQLPWLVELELPSAASGALNKKDT
ncbi:MAG: hypothetical protein LQ351_002919 [Letrouitia transgressa]|nr:MAG: hypothetical protein LQ351_002919 [Letrouitia transgressa]